MEIVWLIVPYWKWTEVWWSGMIKGGMWVKCIVYFHNKHVTIQHLLTLFFDQLFSGLFIMLVVTGMQILNLLLYASLIHIKISLL